MLSNRAAASRCIRFLSMRPQRFTGSRVRKRFSATVRSLKRFSSWCTKAMPAASDSCTVISFDAAQILVLCGAAFTHQKFKLLGYLGRFGLCAVIRRKLGNDGGLSQPRPVLWATLAFRQGAFAAYPRSASVFHVPLATVSICLSFWSPVGANDSHPRQRRLKVNFEREVFKMKKTVKTSRPRCWAT